MAEQSNAKALKDLDNQFLNLPTHKLRADTGIRNHIEGDTQDFIKHRAPIVIRSFAKT
jgi:hypothetical protein